MAPAALAHGDGSLGSSVVASLVALALFAGLALYVRGLVALWTAAGGRRGLAAGSVASFVAGWIVLAASVFGPVETYSDELFTVHMVQHELMMLVSAPLIVLGRPLAAWSWALGGRAGGCVVAAARAVGRSPAWRGLTRPAAAWLLHAAALWAWHLPAWFEAALANEALHDLQHLSFLGTALLFWWALVRERGGRRAEALGVLYLFTTMLHTGALGALLAFSPAPWYASYGGHAGLTALEDQQLGGLLMWLPGGLVYLGAALALVARWLREPVATKRPALR